jgi:hypothetical protein
VVSDGTPENELKIGLKSEEQMPQVNNGMVASYASHVYLHLLLVITYPLLSNS